MNSLQFHSSQSQSQPQSKPQSQSGPAFDLSHLVLVSTLDGKLHALDRNTGKWNWSLNDPQNHSEGLIHQTSLESHHTQSQSEIYAIEPNSDGDLYLLIKSSTSSSSKLQKLPISVSQLVNLSPFTFPSDSSKMFVGKKDTNLIGIDLKNGQVIDVLKADINHSKQQKGKAKETCDLIDSLKDQPSCPKQDQHQHGSTFKFNQEPEIDNQTSDSIDHRPRDLLYIGRTDYQISIYSKPSTLIQTLRYSTYSPSNLAHSLQSRWIRTPDETYLEPMHDGNLICFQFDRNSDLEPDNPLQRESGKIKWQNSFDHPVTNIFDIAFPKTDHHDITQLSSHQTRDPIKINESQRASINQPVMFFQPRLMPSHDSQSPHTFSSVYQQHKPTKQNSKPDPESEPNSSQTHSERAFLGKFGQSFFIMSQQHYPLVSLAPSISTTNEDVLGTHNLLDTGPTGVSLGVGLDPSRLLDPSSDHSWRHQSPLALDPAPQPPMIAAPQATEPKKSSPSSMISLPTPPPRSPQPVIQQRAAQISSLIVRRFISPSLSNTSDEEASLSMSSPMLTILFLTGFIVWLASKKHKGSFKLDHQLREGPSSDSKVAIGPGKLLDYWLRGRTPSDLIPASVPIPTEESKIELEDTPHQPVSENLTDVLAPSPSPEPIGTPPPTLIIASTSDQADETENEIEEGDSIPKVKAKPKRRRGKRPGQKAAALAAKAEAEAAQLGNLLPASNPATASPKSLSAAQNSSPSPMLRFANVGDETTPKPKLNLRKKKSHTVVTPQKESERVREEEEGVTVSRLPATYRPSALDLQQLPPPRSAPPFMSPVSPGFQPQRVGSLLITDETLGYGSHGTVVLKGAFQGRQVAIKRLLKDFVTLATHEVSLLQESDDHPNVVRYFVKESLDNFLYIALELCQCSLFDLIERRSTITEEELNENFSSKRALRQISSGLAYLHKLKIVHRDIKPQNILVSYGKRGGVRMLISDFGLCKKLDLDESSFAQTANHAAGSFGYRAPEILRGQVNLNESTTANSTSSTINPSDPNLPNSNSNTITQRLTRSIDIFSLGCIFYYVLTRGEHPFGSRYEREVNILKDEICLDQLDDFDEEAFEAQQLIRSMVKSNAKERPTAERVIQNPYFWDSNKRLNFLCDCSDRFEIMERDPPTIELKNLEDLNQFKFYLNHQTQSNQIKLNWYQKLDKVLIDNLGKYRKYDSHSIKDLLRVLRNKKHHFQDLPDSLKRTLGNLPEGFLTYFTKRFPSLLVHVHKVIEKFLSHETMFKTYFLDQTSDEL